MMLDRMEGNAELKTSVQQMLATKRFPFIFIIRRPRYACTVDFFRRLCRIYSFNIILYNK